MQIDKQENYTVITADEGKVLADKEGKVVGKELYLGNIDSPENYVEVDEPMEYESS